MADITQIYGQFKTDIERQQFCEAQYRTILELSNKITKLQEKNRSLEKILANGMPTTPKNDNFKDMSNEEAICVMQIKLLRDVSDERELNIEESKKLDTYVKLLMSLNEKKGKQEKSLEAVDEQDLLKALENVSKS